MRAPGWVPLLSALLLVWQGSAQGDRQSSSFLEVFLLTPPAHGSEALGSLQSHLCYLESTSTTGSENDEDGSGYRTAAFSTATVPPPPSAPPMSLTSASSPQPVLVTAGPTEGSLEIESTPSPELSDTSSNGSLETEEPSVLVYAVPAVVLALLVLLVIIFIIVHNRKKSKQDELGSENVKSPIFEEDTPSVMEIEMEELDKWMNSMNKNADCECLPTVREEEKESVANPSDGES
uniref:Transmembrane protein 154 n=1 Tax=Chrysolophus pictus TaxID=9089 RepID=A0A8C3PXX7_CHRPC